MIENDDLDTEAEAPAVETVAPKGNYFDRYDPAPAAADPTAPLFGAAAPVQPTVDTADIMGGAERRIRLSEQMAADGSLDVLAARLRKQRMMSSPMSAVPTEAETKARTAEWDGVLSDLGRAAERDPTVAADLDQATRAKAAEEAPKPYRIYEGMPAAEREKAIAAQAKWLQGSFGEDGVFSDGWGKLTPEQQAEWVESTRADAEAEVDDVDKRLADLEARAYTTPDGKKGIRAPRGTGLSYDTAKASLLREREKALGKRALIEAIDAGKADPATKTWYRSGAENIAKGVGADLLAGMIEFAGIARGYATRAVKGGDFDPASDALYLTGRQLRNLTETAFPGDPMRERELAQQVARGLGQMAGIYGSAGVAAVLKLGPAGMAAVATLAGSSIEASQQFQAATDKMVAWDAKIAAAKEEGAPPEAIARMRANPPVSERERVLAVIFGSIVGASESVPLLTNWTRGLGPAFETGVSGILAKGVEQSIEEGIQEFGQTYASDAVARWLYDPEREVGEQAADSALVGAILGFGFGSGTAAITEISAKRSRKAAGAAKPEAKPTPEELPPELTMPEAVVPAALDDQDIDLAAEETGLPPEKVREALPFAAMITDDGGGPDAIARATRAAETAEDPEVLRALEALTPRAVRKAKASATPAPSEPALPEPEAAPTPPEFDPYSTSLLGTLMREGREPLVARLEQIGSVSQLREMASAQQITLSADMWESETVDVPTLASAIADGVQVRLNDRMAAAESSKRVEVPKAERVARKSTLGKGMAEVAAETAASGARAKAEKVMAEPGTEFSPAALLMKDGEEALADRLDEMSLAEIKRLVTAQKIEAPAKRGALVRAVMDHARARVSDRMAAADGPAPGQPRPVAGDREVAAPTDRAPAAAAPEARETASVITPDGGMEVEVRPEIVDLSTLTAAAGDLQPRDRSRAESDLGIQERAARLDPAQLMAGRVSDAGAPIISADGVVLSGNGRIASIRKAYEAFPERAAAYRKAIGAGPEMAMPVLVQRIVTPLDREGMARFADLSNRTRIAGMSATERAIRDARSAGPEIMGLYQGGDFQAEPNREFYRLFMDAVVTSAERGTISRDGRLTKEGHDRMAAAVLAAAYGDPSALAQMLESTDDNIKALSNAMREAAGAFVRLKAGIAAGVVKPDLDITPQIAEAALLISRLRDQGVKPAAHFAQIDAFSRPDPIVEEIVRLIYSENLTRPVSQKIMTEAFLFYANEAIKHQVGGFIADETQAADIIRLAKERLTNAAQNDLFATRSEPVQAGARPSQGAEPAGEPRGAEPEPAGRSPERLRSEFYDILEGKLPRKQWAGALGVTEAELAPLIDDAVAAKWLRRRGRDVHRAPAKGRPARPAHATVVTTTEASNAPSGSESLEPDWRDGPPRDGMGSAGLPAPAGADAGGPGDRGEAVGAAEGEPAGGGSVPAGDAAPMGAQGDSAVQDGAPGDGRGAAGGQFGERGGATGIEGVPTEHIPAKAVDKAAANASALKRAIEAQVKAIASARYIANDDANIRETLPLLKAAQQDDVIKAEARLSKPDAYGFLLTNGTGTGKTVSGLGVISRFVLAGKRNILILAPSQGILDGWVKTGKWFGLEIERLDSTETAGTGIVATTYANLRANWRLASRDWDLIVPDEAHSLSQNASGNPSEALISFRGLSNHSPAARARLRLTPDLEEINRLKVYARSDDRYIAEHEAALNEYGRKHTALTTELQAKPRAKALFLSATPFAYRKSTDWAEGFLFDYPPDSQAYGKPGGRAAFLVSNFGYNFRYNRAEEPGPEVNTDVLEREFYERLKREGALSGRRLEVDADYDRRFVLVDDAVGGKIDQALNWLSSEGNGRYRPLLDIFNERFDYLARRRLLEAIKAKHVIPRIEKDLELGRKVVVFHDYNEGGGFSPFILAIDPEQRVNQMGSGDLTYGDLYEEFLKANPYVRKLDFGQFTSPIATLTKAFPDAAVYNGTISNKQRAKARDDFNKDGSKVNVIIVQSAAGEAGISLHDTTGKHQRVLYNLGLPTRPTTAIQQEGRIYREGQVSDAILRYMSTGTSWERTAFAMTIAERAGTAENLALGDEARALRDAFVDAFADADVIEQGSDEGRGGKEKDRAGRALTTPFDRAKAFYFGQLKKRGRRDQREGADYYATPEPVGQKMVEWADARLGEKMLEPSAGHGAIGRWFPESTDRTLIEPIPELASRAGLASPGAKVVTGTFEEFYIGNKFDGIVMNPPFGVGGKTAFEHVAKALGHLRPGGRVVALVPRGSSADARFEKLMQSDAARLVGLRADIAMPTVTFDRAGTSVATRILVIEKTKDVASGKAPRFDVIRRDLSSVETVNELFDRIENLSIPSKAKNATGGEVLAPVDVQPGPAPAATGRTEPSADPAIIEDQAPPEDVSPAPQRPATARVPLRGAPTFRLGETTHSKTKQPLWVASFGRFVPREEYERVLKVAKANGGYYSAFKGSGAIPGFQFPSADARAAFLDEITYGKPVPVAEYEGADPEPMFAIMGTPQEELARGARIDRRRFYVDMVDRVRTLAENANDEGRGTPEEHIAAWIAQRTKPEDGRSITMAMAYESYAEWAEEAGVPALALPTFTRALQESGYRQHRIGGRARILGLTTEIERRDRLPARFVAKLAEARVFTESEIGEIASDVRPGWKLVDALKGFIERMKARLVGPAVTTEEAPKPAAEAAEIEWKIALAERMAVDAANDPEPDPPTNVEPLFAIGAQPSQGEMRVVEHPTWKGFAIQHRDGRYYSSSGWVDWFPTYWDAEDTMGQRGGLSPRAVFDFGGGMMVGSAAPDADSAEAQAPPSGIALDDQKTRLISLIKQTIREGKDGSRLPLSPTLKAAVMPLIEKTSPDAVAARAKEQGFTLHAWHSGASGFVTFQPYRVNSDYGFHVAIRRPNAADRDGSVYRLLVNPGRSIRMPDIGTWYEIGDWLKGVADPEFRGPEAFKQWLRDLQAFPFTQEEQDTARREYTDPASRRMMQEMPAKLAELGIGSIIYKNQHEDEGVDSLMLVDPTRVRAAIDMFYPEAVGASSIMASEPFLDADIRTALNAFIEKNDIADEPLFAIGAQPPDIDSLGYYSKALEAARLLKQAKGTPEQMLAQLKSAGVKDAEIEATKLGEFLAGKPAVTRDEIVSFLTENMVKLQGRVTGRTADQAEVTRLTKERIAKWEQSELEKAEFEYDRRPDDTHVYRHSDEWRAFAEQNGLKVDDEVFDDDPMQALADAGMTWRSGTVPLWEETDSFLFGVTPDGSVAVRSEGSGFEVLKKGETVESYIAELEDSARRHIESDIIRADPQDMRLQIRQEVESELGESDPTKWSAYSRDPANPTYREIVLYLPKTGKGDFQSGHFPEPNITGHMMVSEVTTPDGKGTLLIDQIQSDWGQGLRTGGVRDEAKIAEMRLAADEAKRNLDDVNRQIREFVSIHAPQVAKRNVPGLYGTTLQNANENALRQIADRSRLDSWGKVANQVVSDDPEWTPEVFATARKWADELSAAKGLNDRLAAELRTAEASVTGHPLVNTTDQWVDTTLRRGLTEAVRSGKDYIAIPSGKAVLAYNPGDEAGMEGFYDKIVPKNLRKLLEKLDKSTPAAERVETLLSPSGSAGRGNGFVVFRITPEAKRKILKEGQPLFAAGGMASDAHARHAAHSELQAGRDVAIDPSVMKAVWDAAKPHLWIVPKDVPVAVLKGVDSFDPQQVADYEKVYGAGSASGRAIGVFEDSAGTEIRRVIPHSLVGARALAFHPAGNSPGFIALVRFSGTDFRESVAGELRHELVHVLRRLKKISPLVWGKLLAHAKALRILDSDLATYLAMVKDPTAAHATGTVLDKYTTLYKGRRDFSDAMDEEYVAHLMELAYHRELLPVEIEPIRAEIEAFLAGDISGTAAARPKARVSLGGGPAYALTGRPPVPTLPAEADSRLIARLQDALNERNHQDDIGRGRQGGAGDNVARFLRSLVGESEVAAEGKPGSQEGMARSDGGDEAPGRARIDDSLRAEALRLLGDDYTPDAIRARAESQGFTVRAWHGGTNSLDRIVIARGAGWKGQGSVQWDYGFHVALGRPEAANSRVGYSSKLLARLIKGTREVLDGGRVYPLLVNPGKSLRMPDIERWLWASNWQKGMRSKEFDGPAELRQWIDDIIESSPDSASADKAMRDRLPAKLAEYGYGSIVYKNTWEDKGHDSMLIVDSTRVRSAFDLFHPDAVGADGLMASEPAVRRDMRKALNDYAMDNGLIDEPVFAIGGSKLDDEPSLNDIIAEVKRVLDLGVTQGLWGVTVRAGNRTINIRPPKGMRGQYRRGTGGISVRQSRDIGAIAHEGGHALEARYPELRTLMETHRNELAGMTGMLADYAAAAPVSEGFSEFFRSYLVSPDDAKAKAPRFYEAFEEFLDAGDVGLLGDLKDIQEAYKAYVALDPLAAMARDVVTDADRSLWSQMASGEAFKSIHGWLGTAYTALIDDLSPVAKTVRKLLDLADANGVRDADGKPLSLPVGENVYKLFRLFKDSYAQGRIWLTYGVTDLGGTVPKGPSLHDALVKAFGGTHRSQWSKKAFADFDAYLIARRAVAEYDRLEAKAKEIGVGTERLASLSDGRPLLARARDEASGRLDRRERALVRLNAVDAAHRREQASLARKADNLAQEYDLDPRIGDRRRANIRAELRVIEKRLTWLAERVGDADEMRSRLVAERDQAKGDLASARQRLTTRDAGIETTKRDLDRARKRGASRPPTLQGKAHHQAVIEQADREHPEWADAAGMVNEFVHRLLTVRHQAGMITDEMFEMLSERKGWYVPFMRDMSDAEPEVAFSGMAGDRRRWSPFKKFDGSDRAILSPLSVISQEAYVVARQIAYNDAVKAFDRLVTRAGPGSAAIAERLEQPIDLGDDPFQRIQDIAIGMGIDPADASILVARMEQETTHERISAMMAPQGGAPKALPVLPMWEGGRRVMLRLTDPEFGADLFNAINGLGKEFSTFLVDMAAAPARILRLGVTAHPDFMFRNLIRDLFAGFILTGAPPVLTHLRGFYHMAANTEFARNYASAGGIMAGEAVASISKAKDRLDISRLRKRGYKVSASVHGLYSIVGSIETAGRLGLAAHAYKRAKEHNPALTEWQAMQEAAFVARDVIDYGRRGSRMLATARLVTFLNAQIQGLDKAARALGGQGDRGSVIRRYMEVLRKRDDAVPLSKDEERLLGASVKLYARLAAVNLFLYALYLLYADDEEYKDVNDIKKSGMQPVKILGEWMFLPKPFELALPGNLMEIATDAITERDPRWAERMRESLFQTLAPPAVPQAFRLWRDMSTNIDAHSGREIVPSHLKDLAPHLQFDAWTSQLARDFSKALFDAGVPESAIPAPPMIDYLLTAGGAYLGREIQNDYAVIGRAAKGEEPIAGDWRDFMVIRGLTGDPERMSSSVKRFWDLMSKQGGKLVRAAATYDELLKTAKPEEAIAYLFSDRLSPEQRAYAIVDQHYGNAEKRMHPMVRLESVMRIASKIASEALLDRLDDGGEPIRLTPSRKEEALDIISRIKRDEAVNTLRLMGEPGWTTRKGFSVEAALDELGALDPRLRKIYEDRLADKHVVAFDDVAEGWPEFRKEVLGLKPEDLDSMPRRKGRTSREDVPASP